MLEDRRKQATCAKMSGENTSERAKLVCRVQNGWARECVRARWGRLLILFLLLLSWSSEAPHILHCQHLDRYFTGIHFKHLSVYLLWGHSNWGDFADCGLMGLVVTLFTPENISGFEVSFLKSKSLNYWPQNNWSNISTAQEKTFWVTEHMLGFWANMPQFKLSQ